MSTNRSFLAQFLAAFRAQRTLPKSPTSPAAVTTASSVNTSTANPFQPMSSQARAIATQAKATTNALNHHHQQRQSRRDVSTSRRLSQSPRSATPIGFLRRRQSDEGSVESGGFREVKRDGQGPWYIGGRTAAGEERFLRLGICKGSEERLSLDRLSL